MNNRLLVESSKVWAAPPDCRMMKKNNNKKEKEKKHTYLRRSSELQNRFQQMFDGR